MQYILITSFWDIVRLVYICFIFNEKSPEDVSYNAFRLLLISSFSSIFLSIYSGSASYKFFDNFPNLSFLLLIKGFNFGLGNP